MSTSQYFMSSQNEESCCQFQRLPMTTRYKMLSDKNSKTEKKPTSHTINEKHVSYFNIIYKVIIVDADTISCAHPSLNCESEFLSRLQCDWLGQVTTSNLRTLSASKQQCEEAIKWKQTPKRGSYPAKYQVIKRGEKCLSWCILHASNFTNM